MSANKKQKFDKFDKFDIKAIEKQPYTSYNDYMACMFAAVNDSMDAYIEEMKSVFANEQGGYKNVLYPDIEIAHDLCKEQVSKFYLKMSEVAEDYINGTSMEAGEADESDEDFIDDLFGDLDGVTWMMPYPGCLMVDSRWMRNILSMRCVRRQES